MHRPDCLTQKMAEIGWYGPLIDLCDASSHVGDYVQLIVFVHKSTPVKYKVSRNGGGDIVRMDILVGDETKSYFPVTIWKNQMCSQGLAGQVILFQNVKITKFGDAVEARALHCSSLKCLLYLSAVKGSDVLSNGYGMGIAARNKLQKVVEWRQQDEFSNSSTVMNYYGYIRKHAKVNWKEQRPHQDCSTIAELSQCHLSCKASFHAFVGEIFLPDNHESESELERETMFVSRMMHKPDGKVVAHLISTGCKSCGKASAEFPLLCQKTSNHLHVIGTIYRPFLLYVWDDSSYLPILVTNKAAELLFGNIPAEKVHASYKSQKQKQPSAQNEGENGNLDFHMIWLILLNMLLQQGENGPLKFKAIVDSNREWESGRVEMESVEIPVCLN